MIKLLSTYVIVNGYIFSQDCDEYYGADWEGPVATGTYDSTVEVINLPSFLTRVQQDRLRGQIPELNNLTDEWMINSFTIAKIFVRENCS